MRSLNILAKFIMERLHSFLNQKTETKLCNFSSRSWLFVQKNLLPEHPPWLIQLVVVQTGSKRMNSRRASTDDVIPLFDGEKREVFPLKVMLWGWKFRSLGTKKNPLITTTCFKNKLSWTTQSQRVPAVRNSKTRCNYCFEDKGEYPA